MKAYTDIEQSKKLAEILPIESAGRVYPRPQYSDMVYERAQYSQIPYSPPSEIRIDTCAYADDDLPCWSLAALIELLPNEISTGDSFASHYQIDIRKYDGGDNTTLYQIAYGNNRGSSGSWHDMINTGEKENLIDCCVQMLLNLHELHLL